MKPETSLSQELTTHRQNQIYPVQITNSVSMRYTVILSTSRSPKRFYSLQISWSKSCTNFSPLPFVLYTILRDMIPPIILDGKVQFKLLKHFSETCCSCISSLFECLTYPRTRKQLQRQNLAPGASFASCTSKLFRKLYPSLLGTTPLPRWSAIWRRLQ
jgi:hypothetical protein